MESLYKISKQNSRGRSNSWHLSLTSRRMLSPVTPLNLKRLVFANPGGQCLKGGRELGAVWEYLSQKFSFQGSLYLLIRILTGTGFQFRVECPIMRCPNGRKQPEQQVNPSWCTRRPRPCGLGPRTGLRTQPGYVCAQEASPPHPQRWGADLDDTPAGAQGRWDWRAEEQPKSTGHPWRSRQPSSGQTSESRCAGASREPGCHFCLTHHRFYLHVPHHGRPDHCKSSPECSHSKCQRHKYSRDLITWHVK